MNEFLIECEVSISRSNERGVIVGTAQYLESPDQFLVEYTAADGRAVAEWFSARQLTRN